MSRIEKRSADGKVGMAFGVDTAGPYNQTFVQVWTIDAEFDQPCNEGPDGFNNILVAEKDVDVARVMRLGHSYNMLNLSELEVWSCFD